MNTLESAKTEAMNEALAIVEKHVPVGTMQTATQMVLVSAIADALVKSYGSGLIDGQGADEDEIFEEFVDEVECMCFNESCRECFPAIEETESIFKVGNTVRAFKNTSHPIYRTETYTIDGIVTDGSGITTYTLRSTLYTSEVFTVVEGDLDWTVELAE